MANPSIVVCAAGVWTKVATNVTAGHVWAKDNPGMLLQTYKLTGEAAPTSIGDGIPLGENGVPISSLIGVDIYIWAKENAGSVRVDKGYSVINKFGVNLDIDTATVPETIWSHGGVFPFLSAGIAMDFLSSLAGDDIAGIGAQKIQVTFYDDSNTEFVQVFDTAGVTLVQLPGVIKLVSRIEVTQAGSSMTNVGKITVVDRATGAVVYQSVEIGEGQTSSTPQIVPAGKRGIIRRIEAGYARAGAAFNEADLRFRIRRENGTIVTKFPVVLSANLPDKVKDYDIGGVEMAEGDIAFWECTAVSANDTPVLAAFELELFDV